MLEISDKGVESMKAGTSRMLDGLREGAMYSALPRTYLDKLNLVWQVQRVTAYEGNTAGVRRYPFFARSALIRKKNVI